MMSRRYVPWFRRALGRATCIVLPAVSLLVIAACAASSETDGPDADSRSIIPAADAGAEGSADAAAEGAIADVCDVGSTLCSTPTPLTVGAVVAIAGRSKDDVWASGTGGFLMHWDGVKWTALESESVETLTSIFLTADETWGIAGRHVTRRRRGPDSILTVAAVPLAEGRSLSGIAVLPDGDVYLSIAPKAAATGTLQPVAKLTFDTAKVDYLPAPSFPWSDEGQAVATRAAVLVPDKALWVVGDRSVVARYPVVSPEDGGVPILGRGRLFPIASQVNLRAAWAAGEHLWAVGNHGTVLHFDGTEWHAEETDTDVTLNAIFGLSPMDIWAAGDDGVVLHFDGNEWSRVAAGAYSGNLQAIWGSAPDDVWIGGEAGMFHWGALP
jgi:hypothetical protein